MAVLALSMSLNGITYEASAGGLSEVMNSGEIVSLVESMDVSPDGAINYTGIQNIMDLENATSVYDTWENFTDDSGIEGAFVGAGNQEGLFQIPADGEVTITGHFSAPPDAIMSGASEGWIRSPLPANSSASIIMEVFHVGNPRLASLCSSGVAGCGLVSPLFPTNLEGFYRPDRPVIHPIANPTTVWGHTYELDSSLRHDFENRTYLWWSFPWYPRADDNGNYMIMFHTNWDLNGTFEFYFTDADLSDDELYESHLSIWDDGDYVNSTDFVYGNFSEADGTLPIDLGISVMFTEGMGYGVRGDSLPNTDLHFFGEDPAWEEEFSMGGAGPPKTLWNTTCGGACGSDGALLNFSSRLGHTHLRDTTGAFAVNATIWDTSMALGINDGITFFDVLDEPFDSTKHRLTFTMPFMPPENENFSHVMVMVVAIGLDENLNVHHTGSWTANTQVVNDYVMISGRSGDIPTDNTTGGMLGADGTAWGNAFIHNSSIHLDPAHRNVTSIDFFDNAACLMETGPLSDPVQDNGTAFWALGYECADGDEHLHGAKVIQFIMGWSYYNRAFPYVEKLEAHSQETCEPYDPFSSPCYFHEEDHEIEGMRYWLHDQAADIQNEWSWLTNSVHYFEDYHNSAICEIGVIGPGITAITDTGPVWFYGGNEYAMNSFLMGLPQTWARAGTPACDAMGGPNMEWFGLYSVDQSYTGLESDCGWPYVVEDCNGFTQMADGWPTHINLTAPVCDISESYWPCDDYPLLEKYRNWRPFHTVELDEGTKAMVNPVYGEVVYEITYTIILDDIVFEHFSEYEVLPFLQQLKDDCKDIDTADNDYDCFFWIEDVIVRQNGKIVDYSVLNGVPDAQLKEIKEWLDVELRRCEINADECGLPAIVSWQTRVLDNLCDLMNFESISLDFCGFAQWIAPYIEGFLTWLVSRLQYVVAIALEVVVFLMGFIVFSIAVSVIWGGQRLLTAAIYGDWEQVRDLASKPNWGLSMAFSPLKMTGVGRMMSLMRRR